MKKYLTLLVILTLITCDSNRDNIKRVGKKFTEKDIVDGGTLVIGINGEPETLNPLTALSKPARDVISLIFRRLADINEDLATFSPQLAKNWEFSPDSLSITFTLRTDVLWHDGVRFTSKDVVFTYNMQTDPLLAWDGISFKESITSVKSKDDSTLVFHFNHKTQTMLMDAVEGYIVPEHLLKNIPANKMHEANFNRQPIGNGPFKYIKWKTQQSISLIKFDQYYKKGKPHLDRVILKVIPDNVNLFRQLLSGEVDFVEGILPRDFTRLIKDWDKGKIIIRPVSFLGRQYDFIGWNLICPDSYAEALKKSGEGEPEIDKLLKPHKLFGNQKVRAALTMAIDRETITKVVNHGMAIPMNGPIPLILWAYNEKANTVWPYNPELAKKYLREEGWRDSDSDGILDKGSTKFVFEMITNSGNIRREQALTMIQEQLRKINVEMIPRIVEPGLLYGRMLPLKNFDAALIGWNVGLKADFSPLFHSSTFFTPFHFTGFYSKKYDTLEEAAKNSTNRNTAQKYWDKIAKLLSTELPYTWLYYKLECIAIHSRFKNINFDKRGSYIQIEDWWIPKEEHTKIDKIFEE